MSISTVDLRAKRAHSLFRNILGVTSGRLDGLNDTLFGSEYWEARARAEVVAGYAAEYLLSNVSFIRSSRRKDLAHQVGQVVMTWLSFKRGTGLARLEAWLNFNPEELVNDFSAMIRENTVLIISEAESLCTSGLN